MNPHALPATSDQPSAPGFDFTLQNVRWRDPETGLFISADAFDGSTNDPITLQKYIYADADPVNGSDPTGHDDLSDQAFALADEYTSDEIGGLGQLTQYLSGAAGSVFSAEGLDTSLTSAGLGAFGGSSVVDSAFRILSGWLGALPSTVFGAYVQGAWEGASDGFKAWVNGATPFVTPFSQSSFYSPADPTSKISYAGGVVSMNAWAAAAIPNLTAWAESPAFYEVGSTTLPTQLFNTLKDLTPIERGAALVRQLGWTRAATIGLAHSGEFVNTIGTGFTPGAWLVVQTFLNIGSALSKLSGN